jgi:hypothetical protein
MCATWSPGEKVECRQCLHYGKHWFAIGHLWNLTHTSNHTPEKWMQCQFLVVCLYRMIFGVSTTKSEVVIAETKGGGGNFVITVIRPIPFRVGSGDDLKELLESLIARFARKSMGAGSIIALLKCSSGRFGSCLEAIKGEAMVELAAVHCGVRVVKVAPQSLKKSLGCAKDQKWRDRAGELFNPGGKRPKWSKGAAGAVAAAFKVAGE